MFGNAGGVAPDSNDGIFGITGMPGCEVGGRLGGALFELGDVDGNSVGMLEFEGTDGFVVPGNCCGSVAAGALLAGCVGSG